MFFYWAMMLSFSGMYTLYIIKIGFTKAEIGIAATVYVLSAFAGQNLLGYIADRYRSIKKILFAAVFSGIPIAVLLTFSDSSWYVIMLIALWGFFLRGSIPLSELFFIRVLKTSNDLHNFGSIRGFGSIGYGISGIIFGYLLQKTGWVVFPWYICISIFITLSILFLIKGIDPSDLELEDLNKFKDRIGYARLIREISGIAELKRIIIIIFMYSFVVSGVYSYLGVLVSDFGGGALSLGATYLFDAGPEIVTFFLTTRLLTRYSSRHMIIFAFILQIIRLSMLIVFNTPLAIILLGPLSGFAYGLIASSYKTYIYELAPEKYKASCIGFSESVIGLSAMISVPVFGYVLLKAGAQAAISMGLVINIAAAMIIMLERKKESS